MKVFCFSKNIFLSINIQLVTFLIALFCIMATPSWAIINPPAGARAGGMGNCGVTFKDISANFNNQAALASMTSKAISISAEKRFGIMAVNNVAAAGALPFKSGTLGISVQYYGLPIFNETKFGLAFGKKLTENIQLGVQLNYFTKHVAEYGNSSAYTVEIGMLTNLSKTLRMGIHVANPIKMKSSNAYQNEMYQIIKLGLGWQLSKKIFLATEAQNNLKNATVFKIGMEYNIYNKIYLLTGFYTNPNVFTTGCGYRMKFFKIDVSASIHQVLGVTPQVTLTYLIPKKSVK